MTTLKLSYSNIILLSVLIMCIFISTFLPAQPVGPLENEIFQRPVIIPKPATVTGVQNPVISLDGTWKFNPQPPDEFWDNSVNSAVWSDVRVPSHISTQGFSVPQNQQYAYKRNFQIPSDFLRPSTSSRMH